MKGADAPRARAIALMREALDLLEEAGEIHALLHLQWAHDIATREPPLRLHSVRDS